MTTPFFPYSGAVAGSFNRSSRKSKFLTFAALFFVTLTGVWADDARPGDRVAALWRGGAYYLATVTAVEGGEYAVLYDDGDKGAVAAAGLIRVPAVADFKVGDRVLACWKTAQMFPGVITSKGEFTYTVKWSDGDFPLEVARGRLVPVQAAPAVPQAVAGAIPNGTTVAAKWRDGGYYIATLTGRDGSNYRVLYGDGDRGPVKPVDMIVISPTDEIAIGSHVLACWHGARMFPGVATVKTANGFMVKWDDGDTPLDVPRGKIALLP
jgi:hypothetical protein